MAGRLVQCPGCGTRNRVPDAAPGIPRCGRCRGPLPWVVDAGDRTFADVADASRLPVLVDLWAPWCGPCRMVSPVLEELAVELAGRLKLVKVDVDEAPDVARRFSAQSIPTLVLLRDGKTVSSQVGAAPAHALRQWVERNLGSTSTAS